MATSAIAGSVGKAPDSPEITVLIKAGTLRHLTRGPKHFASSARGKRGFRPECGWRLVWQAVDPGDEWSTNLCVGGLDDRAAARMTCHVYADGQPPRHRGCKDLPKFTEHETEEMMAFIRPEGT